MCVTEGASPRVALRDTCLCSLRCGLEKRLTPPISAPNNSGTSPAWFGSAYDDGAQLTILSDRRIITIDDALTRDE